MNEWGHVQLDMLPKKANVRASTHSLDTCRMCSHPVTTVVLACAALACFPIIHEEGDTMSGNKQRCSSFLLAMGWDYSHMVVAAERLRWMPTIATTLKNLIEPHLWVSGSAGGDHVDHRGAQADIGEAHIGEAPCGME